ncbi:unnamed protein product [Camellia sinensis]
MKFLMCSGVVFGFTNKLSAFCLVGCCFELVVGLNGVHGSRGLHRSHVVLLFGLWLDSCALVCSLLLCLHSCSVFGVSWTFLCAKGGRTTVVFCHGLGR